MRPKTRQTHCGFCFPSIFSHIDHENTPLPCQFAPVDIKQKADRKINHYMVINAEY